MIYVKIALVTLFVQQVFKRMSRWGFVLVLAGASLLALSAYYFIDHMPKIG